MNSKYANLLDIDATQPDVFETTLDDTLRESENASSFYDEDYEDEETFEEEGERGKRPSILNQNKTNDDLELLRDPLQIQKAKLTFQDAAVSSQGTDFSDSIAKPPRSRNQKGYRTQRTLLFQGKDGADVELGGDLHSRLERIKADLDEISAEVHLQEGKQEKDVLSSLVEQLRVLSKNASLQQPWTPGNKASDGSSQTRAGLIAQLQQSSSLDNGPEVTAVVEKIPPGTTSNNNDMEVALDMMELEKRVTSLETMVGMDLISLELDDPAFIELQKQIQETSIVNVMSSLKEQFDILNTPLQLDALTWRLQAMASNMEKVKSLHNQANSHSPGTLPSSQHFNATTTSLLSPRTPSALSKGTADMSATSNTLVPENLSEAVETLKKMRGQMDLLPKLVERLRTLNDVHRAASSMTDSLAQMSQEQDRIQARLKEWSILGKELQNNLQENSQIISKNAVLIEEKLDKAMKKAEDILKQ